MEKSPYGRIRISQRWCCSMARLVGLEERQTTSQETRCRRRRKDVRVFKQTLKNGGNLKMAEMADVGLFEAKYK
jgi:hypothetical protein